MSRTVGPKPLDQPGPDVPDIRRFPFLSSMVGEADDIAHAYLYCFTQLFAAPGVILTVDWRNLLWPDH